jgi:hypothetical protein
VWDDSATLRSPFYEDEGIEERFEIHREYPSGEEDDGTLPPSAPALSLEHSRSSDLGCHQKNVASVLDQLMRDYRSAACDLEAVALVELDRSLVLLEDQQA